MEQTIVMKRSPGRHRGFGVRHLNIRDLASGNRSQQRVVPSAPNVMPKIERKPGVWTVGDLKDLPRHCQIGDTPQWNELQYALHSRAMRLYQPIMRSFRRFPVPKRDQPEAFRSRSLSKRPIAPQCERSRPPSSREIPSRQGRIFPNANVAPSSRSDRVLEGLRPHLRPSSACPAARRPFAKLRSKSSGVMLISFRPTAAVVRS